MPGFAPRGFETFSARTHETATTPASRALLWYAAGLVSFSMVEIVSRAFYALHDTKTPVIMLVIAMSLNLGFSLLFSAWFNRIGWMPHGGLALASSLATTLEMIGLLALMRRRLKGLEGRSLLQGTGQAFLAALGMGVVLALWLRFAPFSSNAILALGGVVLGGLIYSGLLALQGVRELRQVWGMRSAILRRFIPARK